MLVLIPEEIRSLISMPRLVECLQDAYRTGSRCPTAAASCSNPGLGRRTRRDEIILLKSVGTAIEGLAAARSMAVC